MISGAHFLIYSRDPAADRAFFRDVLQFPFVELHEGWLIFKLPPGELAVHPGDGEFRQKHGNEDLAGAAMYLMCDDVAATVKALQGKGVVCAPASREQWGIRTAVPLPGGGWIGLYQPAHETALGL